MKFIKNNKIICIFIGVILIFLILCFYILFKYLSMSDKDLYGNRLEGIEEVEISKEQFAKIREELEGYDSVDDIDYNVTGRIVNFIITVKEGTDVEEAKSLPDTILSSFEEKYLTYYDFQVFIKDNAKKSEDEEEENDSDYPIIAYKHKTSENFIWTNNS